MREHLGQFPEDALINADMPAYVHYSSFGERIQAMLEPKTMPGEYEIIATSKTLERVIVIEDISDTETNRYGCAYSDKGTPLVVKYTRLGNDVGHYECVLRVCDSCPNPFQQILCNNIRIKSGEPGFPGFSVPRLLGGVICKPEGAA